MAKHTELEHLRPDHRQASHGDFAPPNRLVTPSEHQIKEAVREANRPERLVSDSSGRPENRMHR